VPLAAGLEVDVAVVGGGIAGLMCAYFLFREGLTVAVVEAGRIIEDVTGFTTGKITSQHGLIYGYLTERHGIEKARLYGEANQAALEKIADLIEHKWIACDFRRTSAYLFTEKEENLEIIRAEVKAAQDAGLPASFVSETPLPFARGAVRFKNQARFHPRKLLLSLAEEITAGGGYVLENTRALDIGDDSYPELTTDRGTIHADKVVVATNTPFFHADEFIPRLTPTRSHVLGLRLNGPVPEGLHYGIDGNGHSIRSQPTKEGALLMVGSWFKDADADADDVALQYERIEQAARSQFDIKTIAYHWWTRDIKTPDRLPFIGRMPGLENVYMAAGFGGWGMTTSAMAATVLADLMAGRDNPEAALFDPSRDTGKSSSESVATNMDKEGGPVAAKGRYDMEELNNGDGKVLDLDGAKVAVYKDDDGNVSGISAKCTHMGCTIDFNAQEKTWDCPCHGSRFDIDGQVVRGPALVALEKIDLP
jgi:glycine/D-amino acid oxidase-like deaminating enzyme/nitrite reductase/ring-hydroxylating ferredoxin subunit